MLRRQYFVSFVRIGEVPPGFRCVTRCQGEFLDCEQNCPCGASCKAGCEECPEHEFCDYTDLLILNPFQAGINKALIIDSETQTQTIADYDYGYPASTFKLRF